MTLTEFLSARLDDDEATSRFDLWDTTNEDEFARQMGRVAAAHRRIAELHDSVHECLSQTRTIVFDPGFRDGNYGGPCDTLRELASIYADHPDYREEWRQ